MDLFNLVIDGRLGRDPELKYTDDGLPICSFSMAHRSGKDTTDWYRVTTFRGLAETCAQFLKSGSKVTIVASKLEVRTWEKNNGDKEISRDMIANQVIFRDPPKKEEVLENDDEGPGF